MLVRQNHAWRSSQQPTWTSLNLIAHELSTLLLLARSASQKTASKSMVPDTPTSG